MDNRLPAIVASYLQGSLPIWVELLDESRPTPAIRGCRCGAPQTIQSWQASVQGCTLSET
ncbi:MAG: hypothetical protein OSA45_12895 [Halioglobus sp.]|nr:hypothetical protein [Halioglobus sp.]